jgi:cytochrome c5
MRSGTRIRWLNAAGWRLAAGLAAACVAAPAHADSPKSGEHVYKETCIACHGTGVDDAPRLGDKAKWAPLIKEGQHVLTAHGWVGVRKMPPKGGNEKLELEEFARAAAYMARAAGGDWKDPDEKMMKRIKAEEKKRVAELKAKKK